MLSNGLSSLSFFHFVFCTLSTSLLYYGTVTFNYFFICIPLLFHLCTRLYLSITFSFVPYSVVHQWKNYFFFWVLAYVFGGPYLSFYRFFCSSTLLLSFRFLFSFVDFIISISLLFVNTFLKLFLNIFTFLLFSTFFPIIHNCN